MTLTVHGGTRTVTAQLSLHVIHALRFGGRRFGELGRLVNVRNPSVLSKHMRKLERDGVVERIEVRGCNGIEYRLTPLGADLQRHAAPLLAWVKDNEPLIFASRESYKATKVRERAEQHADPEQHADHPLSAQM